MVNWVHKQAKNAIFGRYDDQNRLKIEQNYTEVASKMLRNDQLNFR